MKSLTPSTKDALRFWAKVDKSTNCWMWAGRTPEHGYGIFGLKGEDGDWTNVRAHRLAYTLEHGPIPDGMQIDHVCLVKNCVNPSHLRLATAKQNHEHYSGAFQSSKSGVRGVYWVERKSKWRAEVKHLGKNYFAGYFVNLDDAAKAAAEKRNELFTHNNMDRVA